MEEAEKRTDAHTGGISEPVILSIVIITKDTRELLEGLLNSIESDLSLPPRGTRVIIIDNASTDGTDLMVTRSFPRVTYVRNTYNTGFAASVNAGGRLAQGRFVLFLNSDTFLIKGEIAKMVAIAEDLPDMAIIGPQLVYKDLKAQRSVAAIPGLADEFFSRSLRGRTPRTRERGVPDPYIDVESLIGAAIMVRKDIFDDLGGFDERFFFFLEETDFCVRAKLKGHRVVFFPGAKVIHLQGATVRKTWVSGRMEYNISLRKFMKKHHGALYTLAFDVVRFTKAFFFAAAIPLIFFGAKTRMRYTYYLNLIAWYLKGCPDNAGLKRNRE